MSVPAKKIENTLKNEKTTLWNSKEYYIPNVS